MQRSSLTRPDSGTELVDNWKWKPIIIWKQEEKYATMFVNSAYAVLNDVKGKLRHAAFVQINITYNMNRIMCLYSCGFLYIIMRSKSPDEEKKTKRKLK